jgi:hypothetical protein
MRKRSLRGTDFPVLTSFARGYLHEDFPEAHGSAVAAAAAFSADANPEERRQLVQELEALARIAEGRSVRELRRFMTRDLGSRWEPKSRDEIVELLDAVRATS